MHHILQGSKSCSRHLLHLTLLLLPLYLSCQSPAVFPQQVHLVEDHADVLIQWIQTDIRNAIVVNVDAHDDCLPITKERKQKLRDLLATGGADAIGNVNGVTDSALYDISNFITAAHAIGIAGEVVWAAPTPAELSKVSDHLPFRVIFTDSLSTMKLKGPVLLTVDADCVDRYARYLCISLVEAVHRIATLLRARSWDVRHLSVSFSHDGGYLPITLRWIGYALKDALEGNDPGRPDAPWEMLAEMEDWRRSLLPAQIIKKTKPLILAHPENPWSHVYMADALFRADSLDAALAEGKLASSLDSGCAHILAEIGGELANMGRIVDAERFLAEAPMAINAAAEFTLADWLERNGQFQKAIQHYLRINKKVANYSNDLLLGHCYEQVGDTAQAHHHYLRAVALLSRPVTEMAGFADLTDALAAAERFLQSRGDHQAVEILQNDHRLTAYFGKRDN